MTNTFRHCNSISGAQYPPLSASMVAKLSADAAAASANTTSTVKTNAVGGGRKPSNGSAAGDESAKSSFFGRVSGAFNRE